MMETLAQFHFLRPWWLLMALPALGLWWLQRREADTTARWRAVMDAPLLAALTVGGDRRRRIAPEHVLLAAWIVGIVAVAGPTWRQVPSPFAQSARPAMFVLKVTPSMQERDLPPTRLDRAREKMADLLKLREGAPTGLIAYAGSAHLVLPPTADAAVVTGMAGALAPGIMPRPGDGLAEAVRLAQQTLADAGQGGSIVVFADTAPRLTDVKDGAAPVTLFAMRPADRAKADPALAAASSALGADLVVPTIDARDVEALARRLATAGPPPPAPGEAPRWQEAGWWLTAFVALLAALWFRRGWVLA
ncbi:VWA domain-containing protein [Xanthobacter sp. V3C-3]|uniref:VWA domain-containing protein n=1 Tax=Xanthobacter lutulentifluminis TaxID=3119935 RepID=UPI0037265193